MRSFINSQLLILNTVGLIRYLKKYPHWLKKKFNNIILMLSNDVWWDTSLYKHKNKKSLLSGKWFGSSNSSNIENFLPLKNRQNITLRASLAKDLKFFINNELIDYSEHLAIHNLILILRVARNGLRPQFILMSTTL